RSECSTWNTLVPTVLLRLSLLIWFSGKNGVLFAGYCREYNPYVIWFYPDAFWLPAVTLERHRMKIAFFGGTFNPVHRGHIQIASSAVERFDLGQVMFVPAYAQPLKTGRQIAEYHHRFAMLALATQGERELVVSDIEAPDDTATPSYSINSIRKLKRRLRK